MYNRDADEGHTAQDQENGGEWRPSDIILVGIALIILFVVLFFACLGFPWIGAPRGLMGF